MKEFKIVKLFNNTIPLRESVVSMGIKNGGLEIVLDNKKWILTSEHLDHPIRHIITDKFSNVPVKILYFSLPKEEPPQLKLL